MSGERPGGAQWTLGMLPRGDGWRDLAVRVPPELAYCGKHAGIATSEISQELIDDRPAFYACVDGIVADLLDMTHNCPRPAA